MPIFIGFVEISIPGLPCLLTDTRWSGLVGLLPKQANKRHRPDRSDRGVGMLPTSGLATTRQTTVWNKQLVRFSLVMDT